MCTAVADSFVSRGQTTADRSVADTMTDGRDPLCPSRTDLYRARLTPVTFQPWSNTRVRARSVRTTEPDTGSYVLAQRRMTIDGRNVSTDVARIGSETQKRRRCFTSGSTFGRDLSHSGPGPQSHPTIRVRDTDCGSVI